MLSNKYNNLEVESGKYDKWIKEGYFESGDLSKSPYCIVIPPPNVTGKLHIGHALDNTMQDILARYHRLKGEDVLWIPGMDHAGIATQAKIDERLRKQGISRYDIGREKFLEKAWSWKEEYANFIHEQWKALGISVDYRKERFTLDEGLSKAVNKVFVTYYKEGLIYKGKRITNWDPVAKTALSNVEVIHQEVKGKMYYFNYNVVDSDEIFTVATTRPETMFGDVCVVVHPKDDKLNHLIGKKCINPANGDILPIIGDNYIEIGFGTGAMKCTPAHDPNDYQIAIRHNLQMPICMNEDGTMNELCLEFAGMDRFECRDKLVEKIKNEGHLEKIEDIVHNVGHSERTHCMVEPYLSEQWFVKMKPLAEAVLENQKSEKTKINFYPKRFEKTFEQWLENIEDWCISRQLWWGHRIPVWYHKKTGEIYCEEEAPKDIENYVQDEDVLDTWFSSALWPFSTLGWPEKTEDLTRYFPTSCMVTGSDILFFWVARMAFSARHFMNDVPFKDCLLHGIVRDEQGRKMSKSLGNGIDPIEIINKYGCDSLRLHLLTNSTPGLDMNFSTVKVESAWNFINKLWNASRYCLMNVDENFVRDENILIDETDHWIISKLNRTINQVTLNLDRYEFGIAGNELINFVWNDFCSSFIEYSKSALNSDDIKVKNHTLSVLLYVLEKILIISHPFIPFVTEEIYQQLYDENHSVTIAQWPSLCQDIDEEKVKQIDILNEIIFSSRELRSDNDIKPSKELKVKIESSIVMNESLNAILFKMCKLIVVDEINGETLVRPITDGKIIFELDEIVDKEKEIVKLKKQLDFYQKEIKRGESILSNESFLNKAPEMKIQEEKNKLENNKNSFEIVMKKLEELK